MTRSELAALIDGGDVEACISAFQGMPEADRTKLGAASVARLRTLSKGIPAQLAGFLHGEAVQLLPLMATDRTRLASFRAARAAILATASYNRSLLPADRNPGVRRGGRSLRRCDFPPLRPAPGRLREADSAVGRANSPAT
jgi:hypothetical protein